MGVRAYFSGVESNQHFQHCVDAKVRRVLMSYWQFYNKNLGLVAQRKKAHPEIEFMVDSGAHSFMEDWTIYKSWTEQSFETYVKGYVDWMRRNRQYVSVGVELDIDYTLNMVLAGDENAAIGGTIVRRWQQQYFRPLQEIGLPIIYVWHENRKMEGWMEMCSDFDYCGLPGEFSARPDFNRFMSVARRYCTKVHGFAATKQLDFRDMPWYSVDSITWKTGEMYGVLIVWDPHTQTLTMEDDKTQRPKYRDMIDAAGFDGDAVVNDSNYKEVTRFSLWCMRQMELYYWEKYKHRTMYYDLRLPHPKLVAQFDAKTVEHYWTLFNAKENFPQHVNAGILDKRMYLVALAAVQSKDYKTLNMAPVYQEFLSAYVPKLVKPLVTDPALLQQEVVAITSPRNPPPTPRTSLQQIEPVLNVRSRTTDALTDADLPDWSGHPMLNV